MSNQGIIFAATGTEYIEMAINAVQSINNINNNIDTVLYTDSTESIDEFTKISRINLENSRELKISAMIQSSYSECLYLDVDTFIYEDISDIFDCLGRFDLGLAQDPIRNTHRVPHLPKCFPEYNSGVILYRNSPEVTSFFKQWLQNYQKMDFHADQPALRKTLYEAEKIKYLTLPREYNCRPKHPGFLSRNENAKIIHGRNIPDGSANPFQSGTNLSEVAKELNSSQQERVHVKRNGHFVRRLDVRENKRSYLYLLATSLRKNGVAGTGKKILDRIFT